MRITILFTLSLIIPGISFAQQITPRDGAKITTTSVLLEVPEIVGADTYSYHIVSSSGNTIDLTDDNYVIRLDNLTFGESYEWEVDGLDDKGNSLHVYRQEFTVETSPLIDPKLHRFPVIHHSSDREFNGLLLLDYNRVAINAEGKPIWFMPNIEALENRRLRDFKMTNRGTMTYLDVLSCGEITLDGEYVWRTPSTGMFSGDTSDYYHHEFIRLSNGNYMVLGKQFVQSNLTIDGKEVESIPLSIIIEYAPDGRVVWTWSSNNYVKNEDILSVGQKVGVGNTFGHMNSFYVDESAGVIYIGFRDLSCILAIEKESGAILQSYGDKIPSDTTKQGIGFFTKQHAPIKLPGDKLLLFNNNDRNETSSVQIISEVTEDHPNAEIVWEFTCDFDTLLPSASGRMGNALPLPNEHVLVNMGSVPRIFEVSSDKRVVWQCLPERWNEQTQRWVGQPNYRAFHISSLYPYHHAVSLRGGAIRISNEGSEDDTYFVTVYLKPNKKRKAKKRTLKISAGHFTDLEIGSLFKRKIRSKTVFVEVHAKNNPDRVIEHSYLIL